MLLIFISNTLNFNTHILRIQLPLKTPGFNNTNSKIKSYIVQRSAYFFIQIVRSRNQGTQTRCLARWLKPTVNAKIVDKCFEFMNIPEQGRSLQQHTRSSTGPSKHNQSAPLLWFPAAAAVSDPLRGREEWLQDPEWQDGESRLCLVLGWSVDKQSAETNMRGPNALSPLQTPPPFIPFLMRVRLGHAASLTSLRSTWP